MSIPKDLDRLIYLDVDFISRKYEETTGTAPETKFSIQESGRADVKIPLFAAGVATSESRTFSVSSRMMFKKLHKELSDSYPEFSSFANYEGTKIVWISGLLTIGTWSGAGGDIESFELTHDNSLTSLVTEESYFAAGFGKALALSPALKLKISIPVLCLARVLWHSDAADSNVGCPYIVIENAP